MKNILLLTALWASLACGAAEPEPSAPAAAVPAAPPKGRCPPPRFDKLRKMPSGDFDFTVRYMVKADGSIENVRVEGGLASRDAKRIARDVFDGLRCQPAEADQEYEAKLSTRSY